MVRLAFVGSIVVPILLRVHTRCRRHTCLRADMPLTFTAMAIRASCGRSLRVNSLLRSPGSLSMVPGLNAESNHLP